jgi:hypothetical protein
LQYLDGVQVQKEEHNHLEINPGEKEKDLDRVRQLEKGRLLPKKSLFLSDGYISTNSVINFTWFMFITLGCEEKLEKKESWTSFISLHNE